MKDRKYFLIVALCLPLFSLACVNDPAFLSQEVQVVAENLPPLSVDEGHYELWFSYPEGGTSIKERNPDHGDQAFVSMGKFIVNEGGALTALDGGDMMFAIPDGFNPDLLIDALLTIEPPGDVDDDPKSRFLGGVFTGTSSRGIANLSLDGADAFGTAFDTTALRGTFRLTSPSTASEDDFAQGIWFLDANGDGGLQLRTLPVSLDNTEWTYESWLTESDGSGGLTYISLGTFDNPNRLDRNQAGQNAGPDDVPFNVPGEDFVSGSTRVLNDNSYGVAVSLQPLNNGFNRPFYTLLELDRIPSSIREGILTSLDRSSIQPTLEVTVDR